MAPPKLGIIAGGGTLPRRLVEACRLSGRDVFVLALNGHTDPETTVDVAHRWVRLGAGGQILSALHEAAVVEICMIGPVKRPSLRELMPDWRAAKFLARIAFHSIGDDALMQALRDEFEAEGAKLVGVHEVMSELLAKPGLLSRAAPDEQALADIARALAAARAIGAVDAGQAAVAQQGSILALEAIEGTNAMLDRCAALRRTGPGGVLVKARKPQQDLRIDLPTIGVTTVERAAAAGLRGIAVEAGAALIVDPSQVAEAADQLGLFVLCLEDQPAPAANTAEAGLNPTR